MVSVDEFVKRSIAAHPTLFTNRTEVLHFVLCVSGNGYKWGENGEPVYLFENEHAFNRDAYVAQGIAHFSKTMPKDMLDSFRAMVEQDADEFEQIALEAEERALVRGELKPEEVYQQTQYALLVKAPENTPSDWREACEEIRELVLNAGWVL